MLNWLKSTLQSAGFGTTSIGVAVTGAIASSALVGVLAFQLLAIPVFAYGAAIGFLGLLLEFLNSKAKARRRSLGKVWPEVIDSLASAASSGLSITESLIQLAEAGPESLRPYFRAFSQNLTFGYSSAEALEALKRELGDIRADRLIEVVLIANAIGGAGFHEALRTQATLTRHELALWGEIESKQGWVSGTAKIAVAAPWLIVVMLSSRPDNAASYASEAGASVLLLGLVVSVLAYRLIQILGSITQPKRIFVS